MGYNRNTWTVYDETIPDIMQPNSFITKAKLDHIELGLESALTDLQMGKILEGLEPNVEIVTDEEDKTIKRINFTFKHSAVWLFSNKELVDEAVAPVGSVPGDMVIDIKGNIFSVVLWDNGEYRLSFKVNIQGKVGPGGPAGPEGLPGKDGVDGKDGKDGNRWYWGNGDLVEGDTFPGSKPGDLILDSGSDVFEVQEDGLLHKILNIKGADGEDALDFELKIGEVTIGDTASAEIINGNTLNLTIPKGDTGAAGLPGVDGKDGAKGEKGDTGANGKDGADGVGIDNITSELDPDGKTIIFTFTLSNGESITTAVTLP